MPATYEPIASQTLGSAAATITFSSIPQTYTDLVFVSHAFRTSGDTDMACQFNGDTGLNYSSTFVYGTGSSAVSGRHVNYASIACCRVGPNGAAGVFHVMNYTNTSVYTTTLSSGANPDSIVIRYVGNWRNTAAVTSMSFTQGGGGNFSAGSTFSLYGIKAA